MNVKRNILLIGAIIILIFGGLEIKVNLNVHSLEEVTYHGRTYHLSNFGDNMPQMHLEVLKSPSRQGNSLMDWKFMKKKM